MINHAIRGASIIAMAALSACGGGGKSTPAKGPFGPSVNYSALSQASIATENLTGKSVIETNNGGASSYRDGTVSATYDPTTDQITLTDGTISVSDASVTSTSTAPELGQSADLYNQGQTDLALITFADGSYDYVQIFAGDTTDGTTNRSSVGYLGFATNVNDIANGTGEANYEGTTQGTFKLAGVGYDFTGESNVRVDYDTGRVSVFLRNIATTDPTSGNPIQKPIVSLDIENMTLNGSTFSGGRLTMTSRAGDPIPQFNNRTPTESHGGLFGYDPTLTNNLGERTDGADEAAGVFVSTTASADYAASGVYIAD